MIATEEIHSYIQRSVACKDCPAEVRVARGERLINARVIHEATCPWWARYQAGEVAGPVPCGTRVTHRGPYIRRPA